MRLDNLQDTVAASFLISTQALQLLKGLLTHGVIVLEASPIAWYNYVMVCKLPFGHALSLRSKDDIIGLALNAHGLQTFK